MMCSPLPMCALCAALALPAVAQEAAAPSAGELQRKGIEEIVVTAEKRETNLQETPIAITAITSDAIADQGIEDFSDVQSVAPSLVYAEIADMAQITMRGIGVDISTLDAEPGVAVHSDGVYRGGLTSSAQTFFDLERIEVLRGPQGTLYGRNSTGGSLNVITRLPGEVPGVELSALYGAFDRHRLSIAADVPLIDELLAVRGAFAYDSRDGYRDNEFLGTDFDAARVRNAKLAALFTPTDDVDFVLRAEWGASETTGPQFDKTDDHPVPPLFLSTSNPGGILNFPGVCDPALTCAQVFGLTLSPPGQTSGDPQNVLHDGSTLFERDSWGVSGTLTWDAADAVQVKWIGAYFNVEHDGFQSENDGTTITYLTDDYFQENKEWSQEINVSGNIGDRFEWIVGGFYYDSDIDETFSFTLPALQATFEAIFGIFGGGPPLPPGTLTFFNTHLDGSRDAFPWLDFQLLQDLNSLAFFGQGTFDVTDRWRVTGGLRWTKDEKDVTHSLLNNIAGPAIPPASEPPDQCRRQPLDDEWDEVTWKAGTDFDLAEDVLLYGSVSKGFKAGGFNTGLCDNPYDPETVLAYEGGLKTSWLENSLQLNVAGFYYDYEDLQARLFIANASVVENAADAKAYGIELDGIWLIAEGLRVEGSFAWLHAEFKDFLSQDPLNPQLSTIPCPSARDPAALCEDLEGNELVRAPEYKVSLAAQYDFHLGSAGELGLRGEYAFTDDQFHTFFNNDFALQEAYSLGNLRLFWTPPESWVSGIRVQAFVENIGDKDYVQIHAPNATTGGTVSQFAPPRTWGVQINYSWGGK